MTKPIALHTYFTLFKFDPELGRWFDEFGSFSLEEVKEEIEWAHYGTKKKHLKIMRHRYDAGIPAITYDLDTKGKSTLATSVKF